VHLDSLGDILRGRKGKTGRVDHEVIPEYYFELVEKFLEQDKNYKQIPAEICGPTMYQNNRFLKFVTKYFENRNKKTILEGLMITSAPLAV